MRDDTVKNGPLGWLMIDSPNPQPLPPRDQTGAQSQGTATWPVDEYGVLWKLVAGRVLDVNREGDNLHKLWDGPPDGEWPAPPGPPDQWVALPVLHCEC